MKTIGNILWFVIVGLGSALGWLLWAALLAITVVGLPFARQCLKLARFSAWPFGRHVVIDPTATRLGAIGTVLWFIPGVITALGYLIGGLVPCITIIGAPFGVQSIKLAGLALAPFGKKIVTSDEMAAAFAPPRAASA